MNNAAFADLAIIAHGHAGRQSATRADLRVAPDDAVLGDTRTNTNTCARTDAAKRTDRYVRRDDCSRINDRAGVYLRCCGGAMRAFPELRKQSKVVIRIVGNDASAATDGGLAHLRRHNDASSPASSEHGKVFWMTEKAKVPRTGGFKRGKPLDQHLRITMQVGMASIGQCLNNFGKTERHTAPAMVQKVERFCEVSATQRVALSALITLSVMSCFGLT